MKIFISHDVCKTPKDSLEGQREGENRGRETDGGRGGGGGGGTVDHIYININLPYHSLAQH